MFASIIRFYHRGRVQALITTLPIRNTVSAATSTVPEALPYRFLQETLAPREYTRNVCRGKYFCRSFQPSIYNPRCTQHAIRFSRCQGLLLIQLWMKRYAA